MKNYFINEDGHKMVVINPDTNEVEEFNLAVVKEGSEIPEGVSRIGDAVVVKTAPVVADTTKVGDYNFEEHPPKRKSSKKILIVTKDNWQEFEPILGEKFAKLDVEDKKEYKKQYAKFKYYEKTRGHESVETAKLADKPAEEKPKEKPGLPKDLVEEFGVTVVQHILYEKNTGIGFDAAELVDRIRDGEIVSDGSCDNLREWEIEKIIVGLEAVGL